MKEADKAAAYLTSAVEVYHYQFYRAIREL